MPYTQSCAVTGSPFDHFALGRSLNTQVVAFTCFQLSATPGTVWVNPFGNECFTTGCGIYHLGKEASLGSNYTIDEWDTTGYVQGDFNFDVGGVPVRGDVGVRYVKTRQKALGYGVVPSSVSGVNYQTISATTATRSYTDVLPALNLVVEPREDLLLEGTHQ